MRQDYLCRYSRCPLAWSTHWRLRGWRENGVTRLRPTPLHGTVDYSISDEEVSWDRSKAKWPLLWGLPQGYRAEFGGQRNEKEFKHPRNLNTSTWRSRHRRLIHSPPRAEEAHPWLLPRNEISGHGRCSHRLGLYRRQNSIRHRTYSLWRL